MDLRAGRSPRRARPPPRRQARSGSRAAREPGRAGREPSCPRPGSAGALERGRGRGRGIPGVRAPAGGGRTRREPGPPADLGGATWSPARRRPDARAPSPRPPGGSAGRGRGPGGRAGGGRRAGGGEAGTSGRAALARPPGGAAGRRRRAREGGGRAARAGPGRTGRAAGLPAAGPAAGDSWGMLACLCTVLWHLPAVPALNRTGDPGPGPSIQKTYDLTRYLEHQLHSLAGAYVSTGRWGLCEYRAAGAYVSTGRRGPILTVAVELCCLLAPLLGSALSRSTLLRSRLAPRSSSSLPRRVPSQDPPARASASFPVPLRVFSFRASAGRLAAPLLQWPPPRQRQPRRDVGRSLARTPASARPWLAAARARVSRGGALPRPITLSFPQLNYLGPPFNEPDFNPPRLGAETLPRATVNLDVWRSLNDKLRLTQNYEAYSHLLCYLRGLNRQAATAELRRSLGHFCTSLQGLLGSIAGVMAALGYPLPQPGPGAEPAWAPGPAHSDFLQKMDDFWLLKELQTWLWRSAKDFNRLKKKMQPPAAAVTLHLEAHGF
ncbi:Cardiotrophin-like cytokine factor 1 [Galemys pyrenaicus]|uniref:Cardiotrophin-like cytokine factor 1 n=1 Tax=Galemys pyrenaicus TaxID=202257 RepID=A0A8J6DWS8_GALPY|nr:Cardiotrophin-like cytokine factor 1 [Galemys pyrenaicus]